MSYPKEWPGFKVIAPGAMVVVGAIVEGLGPVDWSPDPVYRGTIGLRIVWDADRLTVATLLAMPGSELCPLTPAAREMLALVAEKVQP